MNNYLKIGLIVLTVIAVTFGVLYWSLFKPLDNEAKSTNLYDSVIEFNELGEKIYVSARHWGLAGNHEEIILSSDPINKEHKSYSPENDYIFYSSEIYYKKEGEDKLMIYVNQSSVSEPESFNSPVVIIIKNLKTSDELKDYEKNYQEYGLTKISVFEN